MILAPIPLSLAIAFHGPVRRGLEAPAGAHPYITADAYADEKDAAAVRRFVRQNMLFGVMAMQHSPSVRAYDSIVRALRVAKAAAYIEGMDDVVRVIDGCEGPLHAIHQRHDAGRLAMGHHEHITLRAVGHVVADAIDVMPDRAMIVAYETVEAERLKHMDSEDWSCNALSDPVRSRSKRLVPSISDCFEHLAILRRIGMPKTSSLRPSALKAPLTPLELDFDHLHSP